MTTPAHSINERDASHYIDLSVAYLRKGRRLGHGPAYLRIGRTIRYRVADLDAWLAKHRVVPTPKESQASRDSIVRDSDNGTTLA